MLGGVGDAGRKVKMNMKRIFIIMLLCAAIVTAYGETRHERDSLRHQVRIGWGDQLFESLTWQVTEPVYVYPKTDFLDPEDITQERRENFRYTQHWFAEYQYRFNRWFGLGFMFDGSGVNWQVVQRAGYGRVINSSERKYFCNLVMMPTANFTYYNHRYVSIYSAIGVGLNVNTGSEMDQNGKLTDCAMAVNATLLGISANYQRWFWNVEYGGMYSMAGQNRVYMLKSRMFTISLGVRL